MNEICQWAWAGADCQQHWFGCGLDAIRLGLVCWFGLVARFGPDSLLSWLVGRGRLAGSQLHKVQPGQFVSWLAAGLDGS